MHRVEGGQILSAWKLGGGQILSAWKLGGGTNFECMEVHQNASFPCYNMINLQKFCLRHASSNGFRTLIQLALADLCRKNNDILMDLVTLDCAP